MLARMEPLTRCLGHKHKAHHFARRKEFHQCSVDRHVLNIRELLPHVGMWETRPGWLQTAVMLGRADAITSRRFAGGGRRQARDATTREHGPVNDRVGGSRVVGDARRGTGEGPGGGRRQARDGRGTRGQGWIKPSVRSHRTKQVKLFVKT